MATETQERLTPTFGQHRRRSAPGASAIPAAATARPRPRRRRRGLSPLTIRILALNIPALGILLGGALFLGQYREGLVNSKIEGLRTQGEIIAGALGEAAVEGEAGINPEIARQLVGRLAAPTATRARLFALDGMLIADSDDLGPAARDVEARDLPPPGGEGGFGTFAGRVAGSLLRASLSQPPVRLYREASFQQASDYGEVMLALSGKSKSEVRALSDGQEIVSVAIPVQRFKRVVGALMLTVEAGDIEMQVAYVRIAILKVFGLALLVMLLLSAYLAGTIARPVRRLAEAAEGATRRGAGSAVIPDFTARRDEIGDLSGALRDMTSALYERLDAIEAFAADVAHEIKNPLSSIRSAVESLSRIKDITRQQALITIIGDDIRRIDRLISDISDEARLGAELARAERTTIDLADVAETLAEIHRATGEAGGPVVDVARAGPGPFLVTCVQDRIGQVLRNLLANAVSFSPEGGRIVVRLAYAGANIELVVEDEGPGMPEGKLDAVFDRFFTARPGSEPFGTHSGLGLSISRQIIESHGGSILAENLQGTGGRVRGARLLVILPAAV
jgi:two-component system sensor histidine kinase ChvG